MWSNTTVYTGLTRYNTFLQYDFILVYTVNAIYVLVWITGTNC